MAEVRSVFVVAEQFGEFGHSRQHGDRDAAAPGVDRVNDVFFLLVFDRVRVREQSEPAETK